MSSSKQKVLTLYKNILTLHRTKLPPQMRVLGNQYVRDEFKRHKEAKQEFIGKFIQEWEHYYHTMSNQNSQFGKHLSPTDRELLGSEQKVKLDDLKQASFTVGEALEKQR